MKTMVLPLPTICVAADHKLYEKYTNSLTECMRKYVNITKDSKIKDISLEISQLYSYFEKEIQKYNYNPDYPWMFHINTIGCCFYDGKDFNYQNQLNSNCKKDLEEIIINTLKDNFVVIFFINIFVFVKGLPAFLVNANSKNA